MIHKRWHWFLIGSLVLLLALVACQPEAETVEVTRVVTETQEVPVEVEVEVPVEVTRVVTEIQTETVTEEVMVEVEKAPLGSEERPIKVLFVPSVEVDAIITGGELKDIGAARGDAGSLFQRAGSTPLFAHAKHRVAPHAASSIGRIPARLGGSRRPPRCDHISNGRFRAESPLQRCVAIHDPSRRWPRECTAHIPGATISLT